MITFSHKGDFSRVARYLNKLLNRDYIKVLDKYAKMGVEALSSATPVDTGVTADSWSYEIHQTGDTVSITWTNSNLADGHIPIVLLIQYGHATRNGGYVQGRDFINPAMKPIFDKILREVWREVTEK